MDTGIQAPDPPLPGPVMANLAGPRGASTPWRGTSRTLRTLAAESERAGRAHPDPEPAMRSRPLPALRLDGRGGMAVASTACGPT